MDIPKDIAQSLSGCHMDQDPVSQVNYISIVLQAEEFVDLISSGSFFNHVEKVREEYPKSTICYSTNKLMSYINKCQYENPSNTWRRPPVEEILCKLTTHYTTITCTQGNA